VTFPCPDPAHWPPDELERILGRTLGVPIFQEQAMKIALDAAKFSSEEANQLRKAMATFRSRGNIEVLQDKMVGRMIARGYDPDFAQRCFDQIKGFGEYGFPESHAASFAHLVYVSSWLKWKYPAAFAAALLNSQPMGFYAPAQIVRDAREHGVEVHEIDVNWSDWDCTLESGAMRLGLRQIDGLQREAADRLIARRPYALGRRIALPRGRSVHAIHRLAAADAFRSIGLDRRAALWDARALRQSPDLPLFAYARGPATKASKRACDTPGDAALRACRERLSNHPAVAERASDALPARSLRSRKIHHHRTVEIDKGRPEAVDRRPGADPPAAGERQGRGVHHHRGRDRDRQPRRLARRVREAAQDRDGRAADGSSRDRPARSRQRA
jgi:hypothetical protein